MSHVFGGPSLRLDMALVRKVKVRATHAAIPTDPVEFCKSLLGFQPTPYQERFLRDTGQFIALRWSRQSGKSYIVAARMTWQAITNNGIHIGIVAPSYRQSRFVLRKVAEMARLVPRELIKIIEKTRLVFGNGSTIEAYPNSPLTIRGPTLHLVYCDEMNYIRDDAELYDAILFTLGTTNGSFPLQLQSLFFFSSRRRHTTWTGDWSSDVCSSD